MIVMMLLILALSANDRGDSWLEVYGCYPGFLWISLRMPVVLTYLSPLFDRATEAWKIEREQLMINCFVYSARVGLLDCQVHRAKVLWIQRSYVSITLCVCLCVCVHIMYF